MVSNLRKLLILVTCNLITKLLFGLYLLSVLDERPFRCQHCGRSFRESGALTRHLKSRVSCRTKIDTDLPQYGKTMTLQVTTTEPLDCSSHACVVSVKFL